MAAPAVKKNVTIVGGHGKVALRLARLLAPAHAVTSIIRSDDQADDVREAGATPLLLSLESSPTSSFTRALTSSKADVVYFTAGAGGKGGEERTRKVDYEGAVKVFDAVEGMGGEEGNGKKARVVLVSAIDSRDPGRVSGHYDEKDKELSAAYRRALPAYVRAKYAADLDLVARTAFAWTILRPGTLTDEVGVGKASVGRAHMYPGISRDDVALALALLVDRDDAAGLAIDLVGGDTDIKEGLDAFIKRGVSDWLG